MVEDDISPSTMIIAVESYHVALILYEIHVSGSLKCSEITFRSAEFGANESLPCVCGWRISHFIISC
jgi:hypothetical protein